MDIVDIIKNTKTIYMSESSLETMMDIERVMDSLDLYAFKNWKKGELVEGPIRKKHWVEATFMWPKKAMPDPDGAKRLLGYNAVVTYESGSLKMREDPVWLVKVKLPVELIKEFRDGYMEIEGSEVDLQEIDDAYEEGLDQSELMNTKTDEEQQDGS